jgi:hypothetical protein
MRPERTGTMGSGGLGVKFVCYGATVTDCVTEA